VSTSYIGSPRIHLLTLVPVPEPSWVFKVVGTGLELVWRWRMPMPQRYLANGLVQGLRNCRVLALGAKGVTKPSAVSVTTGHAGLHAHAGDMHAAGR
jgi:hypothetical protein